MKTQFLTLQHTDYFKLKRYKTTENQQSIRSITHHDKVDIPYVHANTPVWYIGHTGHSRTGGT